MNTISEHRLRAVLGDSPLLDARDFALLTGSANADFSEGAEWLPWYKASCGLLIQAFGMLEGAVLHSPAPGSAADLRARAVRREVLGKARGLVLLALRLSGVGPQEPTAELLAVVDSVSAELFGEASVPPTADLLRLVDDGCPHAEAAT